MISQISRRFMINHARASKVNPLEREEVNKLFFGIILTHCAVTGGKTGQYRIIKWREATYDDHKIEHSKCSCVEPSSTK